MTVTRLDAATFDWTTGAGGASVVRSVTDRCRTEDRRSPLDEAAVLRLTHEGIETAALWLAGEDGFAYLHGSELDLAVAPSARGRGVGTALARAALDTTTGPVTAWSHGNHPAAASLAGRLGFEAVRELWLMRRPAGALPAASVPAGYEIRPFRPGSDESGFLAVNAAAFAAHPEQGSLDVRGLERRMAQPWFDPAGFLVAERDGRVVGFHWTKVHDEVTPAYGEVYVIGVDPSTQGSGLGKALLVAGLAHLAGRGLDEVVLYVEGANEGAIRLYSAYGFTHPAADTDVLYARD